MNHGTHSDSHTFLGFANRERVCKLHVSKMLLVLRKAHWCMTTSLSSNTLGWSFFSSALWLTSRCFDFDSRRREGMLRSSLCFKAGATWHAHLAAGSVAEHSGCLHSRLAWDCWEAWSIFDALEIKIHMKCHEGKFEYILWATWSVIAQVQGNLSIFFWHREESSGAEECCSCLWSGHLPWASMRPGVMNEAPPRLLIESETVRSLSHVSFSKRLITASWSFCTKHECYLYRAFWKKIRKKRAFSVKLFQKHRRSSSL